MVKHYWDEVEFLTIALLRYSYTVYATTLQYFNKSYGSCINFELGLFFLKSLMIVLVYNLPLCKQQNVKRTEFFLSWFGIAAHVYQQIYQAVIAISVQLILISHHFNIPAFKIIQYFWWSNLYTYSYKNLKPDQPYVVNISKIY